MLYEQHIQEELRLWQQKMMRRPSLVNHLSKRVQNRMNRFIPEKVHAAITAVIKQMVRGTLYGADYVSRQYPPVDSLLDRETEVMRRIRQYQHTAAAEGGVTGAGGILLGLADFPLLLGIKLKMLFDIAGMYGFSTKDYKERLYILHIFQLAFSSQEHRRQIFLQIKDWDQKKEQLPGDIHQFDWRTFQQEYRDFIDLAKMAQLVPGIGAVVGYVVNYRLLKQLGETAMNAYRMRLFT